MSDTFLLEFLLGCLIGWMLGPIGYYLIAEVADRRAARRRDAEWATVVERNRKRAEERDRFLAEIKRQNQQVMASGRPYHIILQVDHDFFPVQVAVPNDEVMHA